MIKWGELRHIHVIRKQHEIIEKWFGLDLLFLDVSGKLHALEGDDLVTKFSKWNSADAKSFLNKWREHFEIQTQSLSGSFPKVLTGPIGDDRAVIAEIKIQGRVEGYVFAYGFKEAVPGAAGGSSQEKREGYAQLFPREVRFLSDLVDVVVEEIVSFHTEILARDERITALNSELHSRYRYDQMIGKAKPMQDLYRLLDKVQPSESSVLVLGMNGTGKELIAKSVHFHSPRKNGPFVTINCSAFNENLLDSELFGHVKGSFTGAVKDKRGLFEVANKGTLFLDELGDMSLSMQVKLLRVLQDGTFTPVGGTDQRRTDVRIIAATNKNLKEMVEAETFREDLYYRINVITIQVPSLKERKEDIPLLVDFFLERKCKEKNTPSKKLTTRALQKFYDYQWPGNIRELENEIERLVVLSGDELQIDQEAISARIREYREAGGRSGSSSGGNSGSVDADLSGTLKDALEGLEKMMIREGLKRTRFNKSQLARELGISRASLIMKVERYQLDKRFQKKDEAA